MPTLPRRSARRGEPIRQCQFVAALPPTAAKGRDNETELGEEAIIEVRRHRRNAMRGTGCQRGDGRRGGEHVLPAKDSGGE